MGGLEVGFQAVEHAVAFDQDGAAPAGDVVKDTPHAAGEVFKRDGRELAGHRCLWWHYPTIAEPTRRLARPGKPFGA